MLEISGRTKIQQFAGQGRSALLSPRVHHRPQCALCGLRDARTPDEIDGKLILVCFECKAPPQLSCRGRPKEVAHQERVLRALARMDGSQKLADLAEVLDDDTIEGRSRLSKVLARAARQGLVVVLGSGTQNRRYVIAGKVRG